MRLGIALGGGGARGFAHLGVLRAFAEHGLQPAVVTGTSIGALVGAAYLCGTLGPLTEFACALRLRDVPKLLSPTLPRMGVFSGRGIRRLLQAVLPVESIEELPGAFAAIAVDLHFSSIVECRTGPLQEAVLASMAIPGLFPPVVREGRTLVDGGVLEPVPVRAARLLGADLVVAVDLFGAEGLGPLRAHKKLTTAAASRRRGPVVPRWRPLRAARETKEAHGTDTEPNPALRHMLEVLLRTASVSQAHLTTLRLAASPPDLLLQPSAGGVQFLDFHRGAPLIEAGYAAASAAIPSLLERLPKADLSAVRRTV